MTLRIPRLGARIVLSLHLVLAVLAWDALPEQVPTHITLDGTPGDFAPRSLESWFLLPLLALALQVLLEALTGLIRSRPSLFNFPAKARFLKLPAPRREPVIAEMIRFMDVTTLGAQTILLLALTLVWDAARGAETAAGTAAILMVAFLMTPVLLILIARVTAAVDRAERGDSR